MIEEETRRYEELRADYTRKVEQAMGDALMEYNEVLFSAHSCGIEGNSFSVDDSRELKEKGLAMVPQGKSLVEAVEMLDHFDAFNYMVSSLELPFDEKLAKEINRRVMHHTMSYRSPGSVAGEYTDVDMAAGDTVFGDHNELIAKMPQLMESTGEAMSQGTVHPVVIAARFHGFFEYLHPFRDGNGRTGRLLSNFILLAAGHPIIILRRENRKEYIGALKAIRTENSDEFLVRHFFKTACERMENEMKQKESNTTRFSSFLF